jgi:hypothetical protein
MLAGLAGVVVQPLAAQFAAARPRITQAINENRLTAMPRSMHPLARPAFDQGVAPSTLPMDRMQLVLTRSAAQETALETLLAEQQDATSPQYHQWLTPQQFGQQFGAADQDVQTITGWLQSHGFQVDRVANGRNLIEFSGTAGQVEEAFHTAIHKYVVNGQSHWANASEVQIPAALTSVVAGVSTLHNFSKKPQLIHSAAQLEAAVSTNSSQPQFSSNGTNALTPADYATIYNVNPLYAVGINGSGTTIAVVGRSNITLSDVNSFRSNFGLSVNPPQVVVNGANPGVLANGEVDEATLDTTWAGAVAQSATVKLVVSASTNTTDGVDLSEAYIIDNNLGDVMTESFGDCEANYTQAEETAISSLAQQAAAEGITYTVASGDNGAEGCDDPSTVPATHPISVNILASTPYDIAVGGTMFNENGNTSAYWASTNGTGDESALSYIPENVWNESCATQSACTTGNTPGLWAGGGGASTLVAKPSWQTGVAGIPSDGARDIPDVALTAAGHDFYLLCLNGSCTSRRGRISFQGYSGTSAATPSFASIMALIVQKTGVRQGQANDTLYRLAALESLSNCNASNTSNLPAANCIFNDVTVGNNVVPGETGNSYQAGVGYDMATGLGSVNVTNLVNQWGTVSALVPQMRVTIDSPSPLNAIVFGQTQFKGWALADSAAITNLAVAVDGVAYGSAAYGTARPDVCNVYPNRPGCPNVGWSFPFDTTQLVNGGHTVNLTATAANGQKYTVSSNFTVANWTTGNPMHMYIDSPNAQSAAFSGTVYFGGWALDDLTAIAQVAVSVDGVAFGNAVYGAARTDVCAAYPGRAGCPNIGWDFGLDTTSLADGVHTLAITGTSAGGQSSTLASSFKVANESGSPISIFVDNPGAQSGALSETVDVSGWALSSSGAITQVTVAVDDVSLGSAAYGRARPDVCAVYVGRAGCPNVGWDLLVDTTRFADGAHTLDVTAYISTEWFSGPHLTVSTPFTVANGSTTNPTKIFIDQPGAQSSTVAGVTTVSGWAFNDNTALASVAISVDGIPKGNASYGLSRPDVCAAYPGGKPGCPNVGWSFALDTTLLPNGAHTVEATAGGRTVSSPFTVANWVAANPMSITIDQPNSQSGTLSGTASVGGWAIDSLAAIASMTVAVDGIPSGNALYGLSRPDVCTVFPGRAGCPNVGWSFSLNTMLLADGAHSLDVTGMSSAGQSSTVTTAFTVSNAAGNPISLTVDAPAASATLSGPARIGGWALDTTSGIAVTTVQVLVDGVLYGNAAYGQVRGDVCAVYPASGCPNVGWVYTLDTTLLPNGVHTLEIRVLAANGQDRVVTVPFTVLNGVFTTN